MLNDSQAVSSADLLRLAKAGDASSLGMLLNHYTNYMKVLTYARLDSRIRGRLSSSDVVQESLLEAHRDFRTFAGDSVPEFTGWLRQILLHNIAHAMDAHLFAAKRDVRREQSLEDMAVSLSQSHGRFEVMLEDQAPSPSSSADQHELLITLANAIAALPPDYRDVIVLRHIEGLAFPIIAKRLNRSPGATRMLWMRAIEALRQHMQTVD